MLMVTTNRAPDFFHSLLVTVRDVSSNEYIASPTEYFRAPPISSGSRGAELARTLAARIR